MTSPVVAASHPVVASPLRISTMTVTGDLGVIPDLQKLYDNCAMIPYWQIGEGVLKIEFAGQQKGFCSEDILHTTSKAKKRFFNQSSLVFRLARPDGSHKETGAAGDLASCTARFKETNIKLFKNGGFQMTGINSEEMARAAIDRLIALNYNTDRGIWPADGPAPRIVKFDTCMINSDYAIDKAIRRDRLYRVLVEEYGLWCTYEPTIYQGVNTKFFWNSTRPADAPPGICVCPTPCTGEGHGYAVGQCKKITIAPFRTGKIIITGAKFMEQLTDAYTFLNGVFVTHADQVLREFVADAPDAPPKKTVPKAAPTTTEGILRLKMRTSPRNIVRIPAATA
jgi:TATA-box binding protein (TBP) (component of TFIID and TFIIIB)